METCFCCDDVNSTVAHSTQAVNFQAKFVIFQFVVICKKHLNKSFILPLFIAFHNALRLLRLETANGGCVNKERIQFFWFTIITSIPKSDRQDTVYDLRNEPLAAINSWVTVPILMFQKITTSERKIHRTMFYPQDV